MNDTPGDFFFGALVATMIWLLMIFWLVLPTSDQSWKTQIEAHGCGGYYLDANRDKQWDWKK